MRCRNCGAELADGALFCSECGTKVELSKIRFCRECGAELSEGARFCGCCGTSVVFMTSTGAVGTDTLPDASARMQEKLVEREEKLAERKEKLAAYEEQKRAFEQRAREGKRRAWEQKLVAQEKRRRAQEEIWASLDPAQQIRNIKKNVDSVLAKSSQTFLEPKSKGAEALPQVGKQATGLLGGLASGAKVKLDERREEAERKSREQDEGWAFQMRLRREFAKFASGGRSDVVFVDDRAGNVLYKAEAGLLSPKRRTVIKDTKGTKVAILKAVRFPGFGTEAAIEVMLGDEHIGKVLKRKRDLDHAYYFEPLGMGLFISGGYFHQKLEIIDAFTHMNAVIFYTSLFEDYWCKINYNDPEKELYFLILYLAMYEIDAKRWEH